MAMKRKINIGDKYGMLTLIEWSTSSRKSMFTCDCGNKIEAVPSEVRTGRTVSCGCKRKGKPLTHGHCINRERESLYDVWLGIKQRCKNPKNKSFDLYGGRGIGICKEWDNSYDVFREWSVLNGHKTGLCIDRKDNNMGYYPNNCHWTTNKINCNNTRKNRSLTYNGETHTISEWAEITGITRSTISARINNYGWSVERTLSEVPLKGNNQFTKTNK